MNRTAGGRGENARGENPRGEGRSLQGKGPLRPGQMTRVGGRHTPVQAADGPQGDERPVKMPRRPGKLVVNRPKEDRGARGKFPGKSVGKGKREVFGGGKGGKNIYGKSVRKKGRSS